MKTVLVLFALLVAGSAGPADNVRKLLIGFRDQMPCGFPEYGLPALAPYLRDFLEVNKTKIYAKFEDFRLDGLNSFEIDDLTVSVAVFKMGFGFTFEQLRLRTKYDFDLDLEAINPEKLKGMPSIFGDGTIDFALYNLSFAGNLALQFQDGGSSLKEFKLAFYLDEVRSNITGIFDNEVISQFVNDSLENGIIALTKEVKEFVNEVLEALITPWGNKLLKNVSVNTILGLVTGSIPPPTRPPCLPSSEDLSFD